MTSAISKRLAPTLLALPLAALAISMLAVPSMAQNKPGNPATSPLDDYLNARQQQQAAVSPLTPSSALAATPPPPLPFDVRTFEEMARQIVANQRVPGLAVAIVKDGKILSARGYGVTDTLNPQPVDAHTVFRLASLSKTFSGTLGGMLVEDGVLDWNQPVVRYVPEFRLRNPNATSRLSISNLLSHGTGLPRTAFDRDIQANASYSSVRAKLANAPLSCEPGECYSYQNVAFSVFGDVVFGATGRMFDEHIQQRIFKPLGMSDASLGLEGITRSPSWAKPHIRTGNGWRSLIPKPTYYRLGPAAGVNASATDMAQYLLAQTGHRPDILSPQLLGSIHTARIDTPSEVRAGGWRRERLQSAGYGMGWRIYNYAGQPMYFHGGLVQGYRAAMAVLPKQNLGVAVLWNAESGLPSGLLPTIVDSAIGLPQTTWLKFED